MAPKMGFADIVGYSNSHTFRTVPLNSQSLSSLVRLLKQIHPDRCQLCGDTFFWKRGRQNKYSEVH
ncbi:MAG: hypothetical protein OTJ97_05880, partial [SAR202 cluster bacterium]|nr:hypothetical protein [SAR202 cluster bacterium]